MAIILVVEDDKDTNEAVTEYLNSLGFEVRSAFDGKEALRIFENSLIDLVILDIMLPEMPGITVINKIREKSDVPILMLTAVSDESMQVISFDSEADDYMTKPFSMVILGKRVGALLKRANKREERHSITIGNTLIDFDAYTAYVSGEKIDITAKEIDLLKLLIEYQGIVLSREQMVNSLWGIDAAILDRTIDTYIKNIRKKLNINCITTVKGVGYRMERDNTCESQVFL